MSSLKLKAISSIKWQVVNKIMQKVISVITFAILARILSPSEFGLFALAFVAIDGLQVFKSFGLDSALVHRQVRVEDATHTAFFIIQAAGIVLFTACYFVAPMVAHFFWNPDLIPIIRVLGLVFTLSCFSKVPSTLLTKQMRFDLYSGIDLAGSVIQSVSAVIFALIKPSVWCLVWAYLVKQVVVTSLSWYFSGYRVKFFFDRKIAEELFHYGKFMVGLTVLWYLAENVNNIVVGRVLGATMVGYFALAANIGNFINTHFTYLLSGVMFPAYSAIQHDMDAVRRAYFKTTKYVSMVSIPFAVALVCLAEEFVLTLYGEQWLPIVPVIRVFGFIQFFFPVLACSSSLFLGCGKPQFNFYLTFFPLLIRIPLLFVLTKMFGLIGTVSAVAVTHVLFTPVNAVLVRRILGFQWKEFLPQFLPSLYCAFVMFLAIQILKASVRFPEFSLHHAAVLLFLGIAGALAYLAALFIIDRRATLEVTRMVLKMERA